VGHNTAGADFHNNSFRNQKGSFLPKVEHIVLPGQTQNLYFPDQKANVKIKNSKGNNRLSGTALHFRHNSQTDER
jgi:hypothetical protein